MKAEDVYTKVKTTLSDGGLAVYDLPTEGWTPPNFPLTLMYPTANIQVHGPRGMENTITIHLFLAIRQRMANAIVGTDSKQGILKYEVVVKDILYAKKTLDNLVKFFDLPISSYIFAHGKAGMIVAQAEMDLITTYVET